MAMKFFDKDLDTQELKFIGFFFTIVLGIVSVVLGIDLMTGFLGGVIVMIVRDLYTTNTSNAPRGMNGGEPKENGK